MDAVNALVHLGVRISRVRIKILRSLATSAHYVCVRRRDRETRTLSDASSRNGRTKRSTSSLDTSLFFAPSSRYARPYPSPLAAHARTVAGPSLRQARPCCFPVRQGLPPNRPRRIQYEPNANTDNLAAERKAKLAPCGPGRRDPDRNAPAVAGVRRGRNDILRDARGVHPLEPAREGHLHWCV